MANNQGAKPKSRRPAPTRPGKPATVPAIVATPVEAAPRRPMTSPIQFWREVQAEARKITWTSWRETWITSVLVFIMVAIMGAFFLAIDQALGNSMQFLYKLVTS